MRVVGDVADAGAAGDDAVAVADADAERRRVGGVRGQARRTAGSAQSVALAAAASTREGGWREDKSGPWWERTTDGERARGREGVEERRRGRGGEERRVEVVGPDV